MFRALLSSGLAVGLSFNLCSCATLASQPQYILVDSKPPGVPVSLTKDSKGYLGNTPLLMQLEADSEATIYALYDEDRSRKITVSCRFAWESLLLGNLPIAAVLGPALGGVYFAGALGTDILTHSAFECPKRVGFDLAGRMPDQNFQKELLTPERKKSADNQQCRKILIAPPYRFFSKDSEQIAAEWKSKIGPQLQKCDEVIPYEIAREHFAALDLTFDKPFSLRSIERWQLNQLGLRTGATHFAELSLLPAAKSEKLEVSTSLYSLLSNERQRLERVELDQSKSGLFDTPIVSFLDQTFMLIPNSLQLASFFTWPEFSDLDAVYKMYRSDDDRDFRSILGSWELGYVPRPSSFPEYSLRLRIAPAFWSHLNQRKLNLYWRYSNIDPEDGAFALKERLELLYLGTTLESRLYLMSSYGAPFLGLGAGVVNVTGSFRNSVDQRNKQYFHSYVGYLVETRSRSFLEMSFGFSTTFSPHYQSEYTSLTEFSYVRAKAGFYLDSLREKLRGVL